MPGIHAEFDMAEDVPKSLGDADVRSARMSMLSNPHIRPFTELVERMRQAKGPAYGIPYVDPLDGGTDASALFLLEAPGPKAVASGFISRNNPDETAKNVFLLSQAAFLPRRSVMLWNAVPWYIGTGTRIRAAARADVMEAEPWLEAFVALLPRLRAVAFVGRKARHAKATLRRLAPDAACFDVPHPSPMFVNRAPGNRQRVLAGMEAVARHLGNG